MSSDPWDGSGNPTSQNPTSPGPESPSVQRAITDPLLSPSNAASLSSAPRSRSIQNAGQHVRFSIDADERPAIRQGSVARPSPLDSRRGISTDARPSLSVQTSRNDEQSHVPPPQRRVNTQPAPANARSNRNRGYSLRRSLFNRNIADNADTSIVEYTEAGPSSASPVLVNNTHENPPGTHKKSQSQVTVAPALLEEGPVFDNPYRKPSSGFQGVAALPHYQRWMQRSAAQSSFTHHLGAWYKSTVKFVLRISEIPPSKDGRHIDLEATRKHALIDERTQRPHVPNTIRSSRYTMYNFVPRQIFAQFSKLANFYFLCISILQMIPGLSTTGTYTTIIPLLFFVSISIAKEGYDDYRRYHLDQEENNRQTPVLNAYHALYASEEDLAVSAPRPGLKHWANTKWKNIAVGDIIKLERDQPVPADVVLLNSSGENGVAYIETMALDGETNLKSKYAAPCVARTCSDVDRIASTSAHFVVEDPNLDLYNFEGRVTVDGETSPLTNNEVIYRGSILRNTMEAIGMVIYSGEECKIRMNANKNPRIKAPSLQTVVNKIVVLIVVFVVALSVGNSVAYEIWNDFEDDAWYLKRASVSFGPIIVSFIIMFNTMIPLSLYVSLEIVKVSQRFLLNDIDMYDDETDTPMEARTSTINEELGQISYIFSDKTGTLTDNSMKFRKLSVAGTAWLHDTDLKADAARERYKSRLVHKKRSKGKATVVRNPSHHSATGDAAAPRTSTGSALLSPMSPTSPISPYADDLRDHSPGRSPTRWKSSARPAKIQQELHTQEMLLYIQRKPFTVFARKARFFLLNIALCHTCLPETQKDGSISFQAASPDELALVQAAQELGYMVIDRANGVISIKTFPSTAHGEAQIDRYEVLDVIEFSSKRKRMSIVVRFPDGRICVMTKGADSILMSLLRLSNHALQKTVEIEKRANKRKSMEAQQAMARKNSLAWERRPSASRASLTLGRQSISNAGRKSIAGASNGRPLRDQVDSWLKDREQDVDASAMADGASIQPARSSIGNAMLNRPSMAPSEARSSIQDADWDLVDEALVVDESVVVERCAQHINDFATEGLRTLLYGYRFLDNKEYEDWKFEYHEATTSLVDRQEKIERVGDLIERDLELAGATAIEDKLQKGVPETIDKLRRANIKMWMLTGDKRETAINIGHSCRLIKDYSSVTVLDHERGEVEQSIARFLVAINNEQVAHSVVVVDGATLALIESEPSLKALFLDLAVVADSVICCRASPSQKAGLVKAIRHKLKRSVTLAIGDGANDIAMIQEAHVGIGITGKEGLQAARTSDYSIAQFRFLAKLLLVHGRWNYIRTCKYTLATFWKEFMFFLTQALYQKACGYTGTSLYESWSLSMFNTLFTSLAVIILGIFEKDMQASTLLAVPELYMKGQRNGGFNFKVYAMWICFAVLEACITYFCAARLYGQQSLRHNSLFPLGQLCFSVLVIFINTKVLFLEMHNRSYPSLIVWVISVGGWWLWNMVLSLTYHNNTIYDVRKGFFDRFGANSTWWATFFLILVALLVLEIGFKALQAGLFPTETDIFQSLEQDLDTRKRFEEASAEQLQQGWQTRGKDKRSSFEMAQLELEEREQSQRELEVAEMLKKRLQQSSQEQLRQRSVGSSLVKKPSTSEMIEEVELSDIDQAEASDRGRGAADDARRDSIEDGAMARGRASLGGLKKKMGSIGKRGPRRHEA